MHDMRRQMVWPHNLPDCTLASGLLARLATSLRQNANFSED
jgi:hypothetical protein